MRRSNTKQSALQRAGLRLNNPEILPQLLTQFITSGWVCGPRMDRVALKCLPKFLMTRIAKLMEFRRFQKSIPAKRIDKPAYVFEQHDSTAARTSEIRLHVEFGARAIEKCQSRNPTGRDQQHRVRVPKRIADDQSRRIGERRRHEIQAVP
jgi:hypothetical protein